jgi:hypothetical protein
MSDVTYAHYVEINKYINMEIPQFRQKYVQSSRSYTKFISKYKDYTKNKPLLPMIVNYNPLMIKDGYGVNDDMISKYTTSEILNLIRLLDGGLIYMSHIDSPDRLHKLSALYNIQNKYNSVYQESLGLPFLDEEPMTRSPNSQLYDLIMNQSDFIKKNNDLVHFCKEFTRDPINTENKWFKYSLDSSTPLVPNFQLELSIAWTTSSDIEYYKSVLAQIKKRQGKLSDDGDAWVDKHSGVKICDIDLDADEGFDEGGRMVQSREVIESESEIIYVPGSKEQLDPDSKICHIIINAVTNFMGINMKNEIQFITSNVLIVIGKIVPSIEVYEKKAQAASVKGKKPPPWDVYRNQNIILLTLSYLLVSIQLSIPSVKTRTTFPGCIKSFTGYPLDGDTDMSSIEYMACVVASIRSGNNPWKYIRALKTAAIVKQIKYNIDKFILTDANIVIKFNMKHEWLLLSPTNDIPDELNIYNWQQFRPSLIPIEINSLGTVDSDFKHMFNTDLSSATPSQRKHVGVIQGKIQAFSMLYQKQINTIVKSKNPLLTNAVSDPFLENTCCQEDSVINITLRYFESEDESLKSIRNIILSLNKLLTKRNDSIKPQSMISHVNTILVYPQIPTQFDESTIYASFIKLCNFGNDTHIPQNLLPFCKHKPESFNIFMSLQEQVEHLKASGIIIDENEFVSLIKEVNYNNIFISESLLPTTNSFAQVVSSIPETDPYFPIKIKQLLLDTASPKQLTNYLGGENLRLREQIVSFITTHGNMTKSQTTKITSFIQSFHDFADYRTDIAIGYYSVIEDESVYRSITYMKNMIYNMTKVFPNIIINSVQSNLLAKYKVPSYWKLSMNHQAKIKEMMSNYYKEFSKFETDETLLSIFKEFQTSISHLTLLVDTLTCNSSTLVDGNSTNVDGYTKDMTSKVLEYCTLSILNMYINITTSGTVDTTEVTRGNQSVLNSKVSKYMIESLTICMTNKSAINYSYQDIKELVNRSKEKEKDHITKRLQDLSDEERQIDSEFKNHKLGQWGVGLQKGLSQYVGTFYDNELQTAEKQNILENQSIETGVDVYDIQLDNDMVAIEECEINDLSMIGPDEGQDGDGDGDEYY